MLCVSTMVFCSKFLLPNASFSVVPLFGYLLLSPSVILHQSPQHIGYGTQFVICHSSLTFRSGSISGRLYTRPDRVVMRGYRNSCQRCGSHHCHQMRSMEPGGSRMGSMNMHRSQFIIVEEKTSEQVAHSSSAPSPFGHNCNCLYTKLKT